MAKLDPQRLIFGLFLLVLIVVGELIMTHYHLPPWPAFMVMVFFFMEHMDPKKIPHILVGGVLGIVCIILIKPFIGILAPSIGAEAAKLLFIVIAVYAIVAFGEILPVLFNNFAFMFLIVSGVAIWTPEPKPLVWIGVELIGGGIFIAGILGILKIMGALAARKAAKAASEG